MAVRAAAAAFESSTGQSTQIPIVIQSRKRSVPAEPPAFLQQKNQPTDNPLTSQISGRAAPWRKQRPVSIDLGESPLVASHLEDKPKLSITTTSKVRPVSTLDEPTQATTLSRPKPLSQSMGESKNQGERHIPVARPTKQLSMDTRDVTSESEGTVTPESLSETSDDENIKFLKQTKGSLKKAPSIEVSPNRRSSDTIDLIRERKQALKKVDSLKGVKSPRVNKNKEIREIKENLKQAPSGHNLVSSPSFAKSSSGCHLPPPPPPAPPRPPPPPPGFEKKPITAKRKDAIEKLRSRPRKRIDWSQLMKEIESGVALKKVETADRSQPLLPKCKSKGQFVYESEKPNAHHQLLNEIQRGIRLKKVRTNDRSKPNLDGLRKFRRQLTVDEQQESVIPADPELDDIDKLRDDLQATKQLLMKEMRRREKAEHEKLMMETELIKYKKELTNLLSQRGDLKNSLADGMLEKLLIEKSASRKDISKSPSTILTKCPSSLLKVNKLEKTETIANFDELDDFETEYENMKLSLSETEAEKKMLEKKQQETQHELLSTKSQLEEALHKVLVMENKLEQNNIILSPEDLLKKPTVNITIQPEQTIELQQAPVSNINRIPLCQNRQDSRVILTHEDSATETEEDSSDLSEDSEESEEDLDPTTIQLKRDIQFLEAKLKNTSERSSTARNEKVALTKQFRKLQDEMREAKRKYTKLKKELDNMLSMVDGKDESDADDESENSYPSEEEEEDEIFPPDFKRLPLDDKKEQLGTYIKSLEEETTKNKKTNYLLKAKMDKLREDLRIENNKHRELEAELATVLAELG